MRDSELIMLEHKNRLENDVFEDSNMAPLWDWSPRSIMAEPTQPGEDRPYL